MTDLLLTCSEIGDRVAALDGATLGNCPSGFQERFGKLSFSGVAWSDQAHVTNVSCCVGHKAVDLPRLRIMRAFRGRAIIDILTKLLLINRIWTFP